MITRDITEYNLIKNRFWSGIEQHSMKKVLKNPKRSKNKKILSTVGKTKKEIIFEIL